MFVVNFIFRELCHRVLTRSRQSSSQHSQHWALTLNAPALFAITAVGLSPRGRHFLHEILGYGLSPR